MFKYGWCIVYGVVKATRYATYNLNYHIVWIPKYREPVLDGKVASRIEEILYEIADDKNLEIKDLTIEPDHIHIFVNSPPKHEPSLLANWFKGISSRKYNHRHAKDDDKIKWARGYYVGSAGKVSSETIQNYIHRHEESET